MTTSRIRQRSMGTRLNCCDCQSEPVQRPSLPMWRTPSVGLTGNTRSSSAAIFGFRGPRDTRFQPYPDRVLRQPRRSRDGRVLSQSRTAGTGTPSLGTTTLPVGQTYATAGTIFPANSRTIARKPGISPDRLHRRSQHALLDLRARADDDRALPGGRTSRPRRTGSGTTVSTDYAFFAKDDYKITPNLTLNLGVRYEYYSPPYLRSGLTSTIADLGSGLFGASQSAPEDSCSTTGYSPGISILTNYGNARFLARGDSFGL